MNKQELQARMAALPEPPADSHPPLWDAWRHDLWQRVVDGQDPDGFMGWPCVYHTQLQNHWPDVVTHELKTIFAESTEDWIYAMDVMDSPPQFYPRDLQSGSTPSLSRNLIHQAYHLHQWQRVTGRRIADLNSIVEFGGGYGAMALVARRLGFDGHYIIKDLPEFSLLQKYFLSNTTKDFIYFSWDDLYDVIGCDLMIAGYSLSETDYEERDEFIRHVPAKSYLLWYSDRFEDFDNLEYFQHRLPAMLPDYTWKHWRIEHMPPESHYSIGWIP